jgi:transposase
MTIPGLGPISATAIAALAPPIETFAKGRDFAAWLGLTPRQRSTGGKQKLGATSKMGERTLKLMLGLGATKGLHGVSLFMATPSYRERRSDI